MKLMIEKIFSDLKTRNFDREHALMVEALDELSSRNEDRALVLLEELYGLGGCNSLCLLTMGKLLSSKGELERAIELCNQVISLVYFFACL